MFMHDIAYSKWAIPNILRLLLQWGWWADWRFLWAEASMEYLLSTLLSTAEHPATHQQADAICAAFEHCSHSTKDQSDILPRYTHHIL
jgi:hypothetical protein